MTRTTSNPAWQKGDVLLGAGSNIEPRKEYLKQAARGLEALPGVFDFQVSSVFFTQPQLVKEQDWFANQIFLLRCDRRWSPLVFLRELLKIEKDLGRVRHERYGPRTIDLDLLLFGDTLSADPELILPHPRLHQRAFVLLPLLEIRPDFVFPDGESVRQKLARLDYRQEGDRIWQDETPDL